MAAGEIVGCFGLTEPDFGSNPAGMRTRARRDGADWVLDGTKMWITNGSVADIAVVWARADDEILGFLVPTDTPGFSAPKIGKKLSLRASVTSELVLQGVRLPADAVLPEVSSLRGPLSCLNEARYGIVFGALGAARDCLETAVSYSIDREVFERPLASFQLTQAKLADMALELQKGIPARPTPRPSQRRRQAPARAGEPRQAQRPRGAGDRPNLSDDPRRERDHAGVLCSGTPTTSSPCSPMRARPRYISSSSVRRSLASRRSAAERRGRGPSWFGECRLRPSADVVGLNARPHPSRQPRTSSQAWCPPGST